MDSAEILDRSCSNNIASSQYRSLFEHSTATIEFAVLVPILMRLDVD